MLLIMLQFITFARLGATAGAINFNKGERIPSSPVATFDGSELMISKTLRSEIVGILKSGGVASFYTIYEIHQTGYIGFSIDGVINDVISNRDKMLIEYVGYFFWDRIAGSVFG